jgi:threonyl-tRNA synthetase
MQAKVPSVADKDTREDILLLAGPGAPISDDPKLIDYAESILNELRAHQVRVEIDESSDKINGKIQRAEQMKAHTMFVIGKRDMEANGVSVRVHGKGNLGAKPRAEAIAEILAAIKERRA